jgi:hypothetical protein
MDTYNLPSSHIFSSGSTTFKDGIMRLTGGKGVDVVLNSLSGEQLKTSFECVAMFGRFVEIGKSDIYQRSNLSLAHFDRGISLTAVDFVLINNGRPQIVHDALGVVFDLFQKSVLRPVAPITTFPVGKIEEAFRMIAGRKHTGKLVIVPDESSQVKAVLSPPKPLRLDSQGTYVVVGGFGDLGRRVCSLLARSGAGHIVTLSRSLPSDEEVESFRLSLQQESQGTCTLRTIRCDVTKPESVLQAAELCRSELRPVRGVVHSGLVLSVGFHPHSLSFRLSIRLT